MRRKSHSRDESLSERGVTFLSRSKFEDQYKKTSLPGSEMRHGERPIQYTGRDLDTETERSGPRPPNQPHQSLGPPPTRDPRQSLLPPTPLPPYDPSGVGGSRLHSNLPHRTRCPTDSRGAPEWRDGGGGLLLVYGTDSNQGNDRDGDSPVTTVPHSTSVLFLSDTCECPSL